MEINTNSKRKLNLARLSWISLIFLAIHFRSQSLLLGNNSASLFLFETNLIYGLKIVYAALVLVNFLLLNALWNKGGVFVWMIILLGLMGSFFYLFFALQDFFLAWQLGIGSIFLVSIDLIAYLFFLLLFVGVFFCAYLPQ